MFLLAISGTQCKAQKNGLIIYDTGDIGMSLVMLSSRWHCWVNLCVVSLLYRWRWCEFSDQALSYCTDLHCVGTRTEDFHFRCTAVAPGGDDVTRFRSADSCSFSITSSKLQKGKRKNTERNWQFIIKVLDQNWGGGGVYLLFFLSSSSIKYQQLDSGEFGVVGTLGFNAKSEKLACGLCQEGPPPPVSVQGVSVQGGLCPGGSLSRGCLSGGLCPGGSLSRGPLSRGGGSPWQRPPGQRPPGQRPPCGQTNTCENIIFVCMR